MSEIDPEKISADLTAAMRYLFEKAELEAGSQLVVGCSTSEICGAQIGKESSPEIGTLVAKTVIRFCEEYRLVPCFQCCEHLNRSLVMPKKEAKTSGYTLVRAVPQPKAGGSVPAAAWKMLEEPCLAAHIQADAGLDIGDTLIGMHLRPVAVPLRMKEVKRIGFANLVMAWSRLPYIGGERAKYE